jgi:hypothetical protein
LESSLPTQSTKRLYKIAQCLLCSARLLTVETRSDEKAGLRQDAVRSQVIDALEAQEIKETGNEKG